ncbi:hypothetical protein SDC9_87758 [bioreactor metagenome]|uniref:TonB-dependent receptor plug domain-containing protein n=1 Tax=bioreactor metagenome TaxID=1076179 RepID=A0A644ZL87_9ZZZZ
MKKNKTTKRIKWSYSIAFLLLFLAMTALSASKLNASITEEKGGESVEKEMIEVEPVQQEPVQQEPVQQEPIRQETRDSVKVKENSIPLNQSKRGLVPKDSMNAEFFINFISRKNNGNNPQKDPMIFLDGKRISSQEFSRINKDNIKSFSVLKDKDAIKTYGDEAKNGVIQIMTKNPKDSIKVKENFTPLN